MFRFGRNLWTEKRFPYPYPSWASRGLWWSGRALVARAFFPDAGYRAAVLGGMAVTPSFLVYNFDMQSQDVVDLQNTPWGDFWVMMITGNSAQTDGTPIANAFQSQIIEMYPDGSRINNRLSRVGVSQPNLFGNGTRPFILRFPYHGTNQAPLVNHMANVTTNEQVGQIVLCGVRRRYR